MSEAHRLKLIERLQKAPLYDIAAKLRELADRIDSGEVVTDAMVILFDDDNRPDEMTVIGFGTYTPEEAHYSLCIAQRLLEGCYN
jgi:hypothetical protein